MQMIKLGVMYNKQNSYGFTLVELSIVLVIIGLLIGGVLVAQTMIENARMKDMVKKVQQLDIMAANFKSAYGSLPGDSDKITPQGNDNGILEEQGDNSFVQLHQAGLLIDQPYTASATSTNLCNAAGTEHGTLFFFRSHPA